MSEKMKILDALNELEELGSAEKIFEKLIEDGIVGRTHNATECVIAKWSARKTGLKISCGLRTLSCDLGIIIIPPTVREAIRKFDNKLAPKELYYYV